MADAVFKSGVVGVCAQGVHLFRVNQGSAVGLSDQGQVNVPQNVTISGGVHTAGLGLLHSAGKWQMTENSQQCLKFL